MATKPAESAQFGSISSNPGGRNKTRKLNTSIGDINTDIPVNATVNEVAAAKSFLVESTRRVTSSSFGLAGDGGFTGGFIGRDQILAAASAETLTYIAAVEAADEQQLENGVLAAMVAHANWRIPLGGASVLQSGPRTLAGKLIPMVGPNPIGVNLEADDVSRWGGIGGDGVGKYIRTQYSHLNLNQDSVHAGVWVNASHSGGSGGYIGAGGTNSISMTAGASAWSLRCSTTISSNGAGIAVDSTGALILSRTASDSYQFSGDDTSATISEVSIELLQDREFYVGAAHSSLNVAASFANAVVGGYSVGPYIDPAEWTARMNTYMGALAAAADGTWAAGGGLPALDLEF